MTEPTDRLAALLGEAERATFHSSPAQALASIAEASTLAIERGAAPELVVLAWLQAVCLAATGSFESALQGLTVMLGQQAADPRTRLVISWASSVAASVHRQLGRTDDAEELDSFGLAAADPLGVPGLEGALDCVIGLTSDAVGRGDLELANERLRDAEARVDAAGESARWRPRCRLDWARAEIALAVGDAAVAGTAAAGALALAVANAAPRHQAKSQLFAGLAALSAGDLPSATAALGACVEQASALGCLPLIWRPAGLLSALSAGSDPQASAGYLATARSAASSLARATPESLRGTWLARPDVTALLPDGIDSVADAIPAR